MTDSDQLDLPAPASTDRAAVLVATGILFSRLSGIVREILLAAWLGVGTIAAEAFAFSLTVPKIMQNLLGEGALSASFIPVYSQVVDRDPRAARRLAGAVFGLLAALVGGFVLVLVLAADPIVALLARGASAERADLIAELLRTMAPGIGFIVFAAWCLGILNAHRDFFLSYVAPMLWNIAIIAAGLIWWTQTSDPVSLARAAAWGVFIGGVAQFAVQLPRVLRIAGPITPSIRDRSSDTQSVIKRFIPGVAGRGVITLSSFVDLLLSSFLAVGAYAVIAKAQVLYALPISVFALSIAAADLPELSRETEEAGVAAARVRTAIDRVTLFVGFSAVAFVFAGQSVVGALFERGEFDSDDTIVVWFTLAVFSLGLIASALSRVFQAASYAHGDVAGPAKIAFARMVMAAIVGVLLMLPADRFRIVGGVVERTADFAWSPLETSVRDVPNSHRLGAVGLAAGGAVAAWLEFALLRRRLAIFGPDLGIWRSIRRLILPGVAASLIAWGLSWGLDGLHALIAAPLIVGPAGIAFVWIASRTGNATATSLLDQARSLTGPR